VCVSTLVNWQQKTEIQPSEISPFLFCKNDNAGDLMKEYCKFLSQFYYKSGCYSCKVFTYAPIQR
jgi:hypothetical protein